MRSFSIIVIFIAAAILGCALLPLLPVKLMPSETLPSISVSYAMQGASPATVEAEATSRLESALATMSGVKGISSKSYSGGGRISVEFDRHADMETKRFEVSAIVRQIWSELPEGVTYPSISVRTASKEGSGPFMAYTLNAPANPADIQAYGEENIGPMLARIDGVADVSFNGARPMEWKLTYDTDRLAAIGLTPGDIRNAISAHLGSAHPGMAESDGEGYLSVILKTGGDGAALNAAEIPVALKGGGSISLDKLVEVSHSEARAKSHFRINGLNSIYVYITADELANQLELASAIERETERLRASMPQGYSIEKSFDSTENIREELDRIYFRSGLTVLILLLFVGLVSLSIRYVALITISLAINLAVAAGFYYLAGIEIQLYSLAGITISLNLIIDNLIVMTDHFTRHRDRRAFTSILAATLTTIGALSVVFFLDDTTRLSLADFVGVVIINLAVSLFVALALVPALAERLGVGRRGARPRKKGLRSRIALFLSRCYGATLRVTLRFRVIFLILIAAAFGWSVYIFATKVYNGEYWNRDQGEPVLQIYATLPNGSTIEQMDALIRRMEAFLAGWPEIRQFQTSVQSARRASISVYFTKENRTNGFPYRLKNEVVGKALTLGGGSWSVFGLDDMGFNNDVRENAGSYRVKLTGYNYDDLSAWAYRMRDTLLSHRRIKEVTVASEFSYWKDDYTEFEISIDRERLAALGLNATQLFAAIEPTFGVELQAGSISTERGNERICLYSAQASRYDVFTLMHQPFVAAGRTFTLSDIGTFGKRQAPKEIVKRNQEYEICLQYEYIGSPKQGERVLERDLETINSLMPVGYQAKDEKQQWREKDDKGKYWLLALVAVIIFFISSILFNSLRQPFAIIFMIPVSMIGVFMTFYLFRLKFDQGGFASMILLAGITVNAAIYLISEYNDLRRRHPRAGASRLFARAMRVKITPILLTVVSTVLGFIPFLIGTSKESFWFPLAAGTIGGLAVSLLAVILLLPLLLLRRYPKSARGRTNRASLLKSS